jgi:hypothetical protein
MKQSRIFFAAILIIVIGWHANFYFSSKTKISGFFQVMPANIGYTWSDEANTNPHYFWQTTKVVWRKGIKHPNYNVQTTAIENNWSPMPGYIFANDIEGDLKTVWKIGLKHPDLNIFTSETEGSFHPGLGWEWVDPESKNNLLVRWVPGQRFESLKVISKIEPNTWEPYAGYSFINPDKNIEVAWTPGLKDPTNHPDQISGSSPDEWLAINASSESETDTEPIWLNGLKFFAYGLIGDKIKENGGPNFIANEFYKGAFQEAAKAVEKAFQ